MEILALIPDRSGSKGIKGKNIKLFNNKPLIYWSIDLAKRCKYITRIICSTDSNDIAKIANKCGAETPFLRPKNISNDLSTDYECIEHCLRELYENEPASRKIPSPLSQKSKCKASDCPGLKRELGTRKTAIAS